MRTLFIVSILFFSVGLFGQINVNFPINAIDALVDYKGAVDNLAGLSALTDAQEGQLTWIRDINEFRIYDGSSWISLPSGGIPDGDKGDITVASSGASLTINTGAVGVDELDAAAVESEYNNQVSVVSQAEAEAGISTTVRRWTAQRVAQAVAAQSTNSTAPKTIYLAGFGQSNMDETSSSGDGGDTTSTDQIKVRMEFLDQDPYRWEPTYNSPLFQAAKEHIRQYPQDTVICILAAVSNTSINQWYADSTLRNRAETIFSQLGNPRASAIYWMQGERDRFGNAAGINGGAASVQEANDNYYQVWYDSVYNWIINQTWASAATPIVVGTTYDQPDALYYQITVNDALYRIGHDDVSNTKVADFMDLSTIDFLHYTGPAIDTMGRRFYNQGISGPVDRESLMSPRYAYDQSTGYLTNDFGDSILISLPSSGIAVNRPAGYTRVDADSVFTGIYIDSISATRSTFNQVIPPFSLDLPGWQDWEGNAYTTGDGYLHVEPVGSDSIYHTTSFGQLARWVTPGYIHQDSTYSIRSTWYMTGGAYGGWFIGFNNGTGDSNGWLIQRNTNDLRLVRFDESTGSSVKATWDNNITVDTDYDILIRKVGKDSIIVNVDGVDRISYAVPLADQFDFPGAVGFLVGTSNTPPDLKIKNIVLSCGTNVDAGNDDLMSWNYVNRGEISFVTEDFNTVSVRVDSIAASKIKSSHSATNYTAAADRIDDHLSGIDTRLADIPADAGDIDITDIAGGYASTAVEGALQELTLQSEISPANASTISITKYRAFILIDDLNGSTQTQTLSTTNTPDGSRVFIKSDAATSVTFSTSSGNFVPSGTITGSPTIAITGVGELELMWVSSLSAWFQIN